jgi:hypothetical protein
LVGPSGFFSGKEGCFSIAGHAILHSDEIEPRLLTAKKTYFFMESYKTLRNDIEALG